MFSTFLSSYIFYGFDPAFPIAFLKSHQVRLLLRHFPQTYKPPRVL